MQCMNFDLKLRETREVHALSIAIARVSLLVILDNYRSMWSKTSQNARTWTCTWFRVSIQSLLWLLLQQVPIVGNEVLGAPISPCCRRISVIPLCRMMLSQSAMHSPGRMRYPLGCFVAHMRGSLRGVWIGVPMRYSVYSIFLSVFPNLECGWICASKNEALLTTLCAWRVPVNVFVMCGLFSIWGVHEFLPRSS